MSGQRVGRSVVRRPEIGGGRRGRRGRAGIITVSLIFRAEIHQTLPSQFYLLVEPYTILFTSFHKKPVFVYKANHLTN